MITKQFFLILPLISTSLCFSLPDFNTELYLDLMKKCLLNTIYKDPDTHLVYNEYNRLNGLDWPKTAHTMIGLKQLNNIQFCVEDTLKNNIPGDFIETGVWRGGATILMRATLKAHNIKDRRVWVADSFEGIPPTNLSLYPADAQGNAWHTNRYLAISINEVKSNFERYNLLDEQVVFLKGFFKDTLPTAPIQQIAVLRLDGDLYESTMDSLVHLYHKLSIGGYIILDDYFNITCCRQAVDDFRKANNITDEIKQVDDHAIFWKKTK